MEVTSANYEREVVRSEKPVLLDFHAGWCGPCRIMEPLVDELDKTRDNLKVAKVDIDAYPEIAEKYNVLSIPTLVLVDGGEEVARTIGAQPKAKLQAFVDSRIQWVPNEILTEGKLSDDPEKRT